MLKNIVFDMGNVLLDYDPEVSLNLYCKSSEAKEIIRRELFGGPEWAMGDIGEIRDSERYERVKKRVPLQYHEELRCCAEGWDICMQPLPGAKEFCDYAKKMGYGIYVLSNASDLFYKYFLNFAPLEFFDGVMISSDVHLLKPDLKIYDLFLFHYNLCAKECLFIDDREDNVQGARQAGMSAVQFEGSFQGMYGYLEKQSSGS